MAGFSTTLNKFFNLARVIWGRQMDIKYSILTGFLFLPFQELIRNTRRLAFNCSLERRVQVFFFLFVVNFSLRKWRACVMDYETRRFFFGNLI